MFRMAAAVSEIITSSTHITIFRVLLDIWPGKKADAHYGVLQCINEIMNKLRCIEDRPDSDSTWGNQRKESNTQDPKQSDKKEKRRWIIVM